MFYHLIAVIAWVYVGLHGGMINYSKLPRIVANAYFDVAVGSGDYVLRGGAVDPVELSPGARVVPANAKYLARVDGNGDLPPGQIDQVDIEALDFVAASIPPGTPSFTYSGKTYILRGVGADLFVEFPDAQPWHRASTVAHP